MDYLNAIIFGITQGITEFLPISSSGHLVILHKFFHLPLTNELVFDVILHFATLLAVIYFFRKDIKLLLISWFRSFRGERSEYGKLSWLILLSTIPAGLIGFYLDDLIETKFRSVLVVASMLIAVGFLFILVERISRKTDDMKNLNWQKTLIIGLTQAIALIPGTSRSGITIIAGMTTGLKREAALKFSFLMSIPIIVGAALKEIPKIFNTTINNNEIIIIVIAFLAAYISGFLAIKYFLRFAKNNSLNIFAYYRILLGVILIFYFFMYN